MTDPELVLDLLFDIFPLMQIEHGEWRKSVNFNPFGCISYQEINPVGDHYMYCYFDCFSDETFPLLSLPKWILETPSGLKLWHSLRVLFLKNGAIKTCVGPSELKGEPRNLNYMYVEKEYGFCFFNLIEKRVELNSLGVFL